LLIGIDAAIHFEYVYKTKKSEREGEGNILLERQRCIQFIDYLIVGN